MSNLNTKPNIDNPDEFYAELLTAHENLTDDESLAFNARLVLILANQIGDRGIIAKALALAGNPSGGQHSGQ